jgi:hypothetical protein
MKILFVAISFLFVFSGCVKNNPLPVFLQINAWTLNDNPNITEEGELTHNFSNAWVYIDGTVLGVFEVPCKIPVLAEGNHKVTVFPTILNNGISDTKKIYPFVKPYETTIDMVVGQTYTINPQTMHYDNVHFWVEDFENSNIKIEEDPQFSLTTMQIENDASISKWGKYAHVHVTPTDSMWIGVTTDQMILPKNGAEIYFEINYRNDNSILYGLQDYTNGTKTDHPLVQMNAQNQMVWKKMYIDLKQDVSSTQYANYYKHFLRIIHNNNLSAGDVFIDNIKVVYFQ